VTTPSKFIDALKKYVGVPYLWGGKHPSQGGLDCSGLITLALADVGVQFPHGSVNQINATTQITVDQGWRTPGALLYREGHDAISLGDGTAIEAIRPRVAITNRTATLNGKPRFTRAGLIPELARPTQTRPIGGTMISPFEGRYTSWYNLNRWITYKGRRIKSPHAGADIAPPKPGQTGLPVRAMFDGTVEKAVAWAKPGNSSSTWAPQRTGNGTLISNPDGEGQGYNHMRPTVSEGQKVKAGQIIGYNDRSGRQTGPHLHLETWANWRDPNSHYDPMILFRKYNVTIGSAYRPTQPSTPPTPKEYFDMDKKTFENGLDAAFKRNADYLIGKLFASPIKISGALAKRLGVKTMNVSTVLRHSAATLTESREKFTQTWRRLNNQNEVLRRIANQTVTNEKELKEINALLDERLPEVEEVSLNDLAKDE